jgi:hypothetical protein
MIYNEKAARLGGFFASGAYHQSNSPAPSQPPIAPAKQEHDNDVNNPT